MWDRYFESILAFIVVVVVVVIIIIIINIKCGCGRRQLERYNIKN
jgi:hypothetical protein